MAFTIISLFVSPTASRTGQFRSLADIPGHLTLLIAGGLALGTLATIAYGRLDLKFALTIPSFVVLTDLDHIPSALGVAQTIRPAHSFVFVVAVFFLIAAVTKDWSLSVAAVSGFFAHIGTDTGIFAFFSPISFNYYQSNQYTEATFLTIALATAILAGYLARRGASLKPE